ncbi:hypothetical protein BDR07DRAFT_1423334 [Suillus spraguei]|nr:hypothetical protein BDR07DRAFT_1423334 [Suillus spraguei]
MMDICQLLVSFNTSNLTFSDLTAFVQLACMAKPFIHQCMTDIHHLPTHPPEVVIWTHDTVLPTDQEIEAFNHHGLMRGIGYHDLYPPTHVCQSPECMNHHDGNEVATLTDPLYATRWFSFGPFGINLLSIMSCQILPQLSD